MFIDPGKLRHVLTVERPSSTRDAAGEYQQTWSPVATRFGFVKPLSGRELFNAQQVNALVSHSVAMRRLDGLTTQDRLGFRGRVLGIVSIVNVDEYGEFFSLLCTEQTGPAPNV